MLNRVSRNYRPRDVAMSSLFWLSSWRIKVLRDRIFEPSLSRVRNFLSKRTSWAIISGAIDESSSTRMERTEAASSQRFPACEIADDTSIVVVVVVKPRVTLWRLHASGTRARPRSTKRCYTALSMITRHNRVARLYPSRDSVLLRLSYSYDLP